MDQLVTPGPVPISKNIQKALISSGHLHHRSQAFKSLFQSVLEGLKIPFQTRNHVFIILSSGTGAMEASIINTLNAYDEVLVICSGKFGERWRDIGRVFGLQVHTLSVEWGKVVNLKALKKALKNKKKIKAVFFQACETSTGVLHDVKHLAKTIKDFNSEILISVDASTALTATEILTDDWNLDVVLASSQKGFQLPAGLSFLSLSSLAFQFLEQSRLPKYYFDLKAEKKANDNFQTAFSPSVSLILALKESLKDFKTSSDLKKKINYTKLLSSVTIEWAKSVGLKPLAETPSPSVSALIMPKGVSGQKVKDIMEKKYRITVAGGQSHLREKIIRIGHMGHVTKDITFKTLKALGESLEEEGYKIYNLNESLQKVSKTLEKGK